MYGARKVEVPGRQRTMCNGPEGIESKHGVLKNNHNSELY
jgi:hypothetical protein